MIGVLNSEKIRH